MEFKVIIYILVAIFYFVYTAIKKGQEQKNVQGKPVNKPVSPPAAKGFEEILRELQRKQEAAARQSTVSKPTVSATSYQPKKQKEVLIHQKQPGVFAEGNYERELTSEEKVERGKLTIANEGIYKIKSAEEQELETTTYQLDARQAIIGSIIFERKF